MDDITRQRGEIIALYREGILSKGELTEQLAALAIQIRHLDARDGPRPARNPAPAMDEKHNDEPPMARARRLSDAEVDEVLGDLLAEDPEPELEQKDAPEEHKEYEEGPRQTYYARLVHYRADPRRVARSVLPLKGFLRGRVR